MSKNTGGFSFEDKIDIINESIAKRRGKWRLTALSYIDYDDISQILRIHIYEKWGLWDQSRPLEQWLNRIITNQIINLIRNHYGRVAPPCNGCPYNTSEDICSFTPSGNKCSECPLFAKWEKKTQVGYNIKLASSTNSEDFIEPRASATSFEDHINYEDCSQRIHKIMKENLSASDYKIYDLLIIQNISDKEAAALLNLKSNERGRCPGYKHINNMRNKFYEMAKKIIKENDIIL